MSELKARLEAEGNPLIDDNEALFVWIGDEAPYLHVETNNFQAVSMQRIEEGVWTYPAILPPDAYIEYNFCDEENDPDTIVPDPYNANTTDTGVGHDNNYFTMPEKVHTPYIMTRYGIPSGTVTEHDLTYKVLGMKQTRSVWLYEPPTNDPVPLLVVLDGKDYHERGKIVEIVDNLIEDGKIQPIAMALIDNAGENRTLEYNQNDTVPMMLESYLLPFVEKHLNLLDVGAYVGGYGILGGSMGGLMALYTGLRMPDVFGKVISQAGAFVTFKDGRPALIHTLVDTLPKADLKIWLDIGLYDWLFDVNQDMRQRLGAKGYDVSYAEHSGGHNYTSWRDLLPTALETMFGA